MITEFKHMDIIFENVDAVRLTPDHVKGLLIEDITESIGINSSKQYWNSKNCKLVVLQLTPEALDVTSLLEEELGDHLIYWHDITHISIEDINGNTNRIVVPWNNTEESPTTNLLEETDFSEELVTVNIKDPFYKG